MCLRLRCGNFTVLIIVLILRHLTVLGFVSNIAFSVVFITDFAGNAVLRRLACDTLQTFHTIAVNVTHITRRVRSSTINPNMELKKFREIENFDFAGKMMETER